LVERDDAVVAAQIIVEHNRSDDRQAPTVLDMANRARKPTATVD